MSLTYHDHMLTIQREHREALRLLAALNEGEDGVMPQVHVFLRKVKERQETERVAKAVASQKREQRKAGGRKNSDKFEVVPRMEGGVDYGATGLVIARRGNVRLIWRSGHTFWADQLTGSTYTPGDLVVMTSRESSKQRPQVVSLTDNHRNPGTPDTRLSRKLLERYKDKIDAVFGEGAAEQLYPLKQTVHFEECPV